MESGLANSNLTAFETGHIRRGFGVSLSYQEHLASVMITDALKPELEFHFPKKSKNSIQFDRKSITGYNIHNSFNNRKLGIFIGENSRQNQRMSLSLPQNELQCSAQMIMLRTLTILFIAFALIGCKNPSRSETVEADHELKIVRKGKTLVMALPYVSAQGDGNQVRIYLPGGEYVLVDVNSSGCSSTVCIPRAKPDGTPVLFEFQPDGKAINRSEHPFGTLPGDEGFKPSSTAEHAAPSDGDKPPN